MNKTDVIYPNRFQQKIFTMEAPGKEAAHVELTVPSIIVPGEIFSIKLSILDDMGYPSVTFDETLSVKLGSSVIADVKFAEASPAIAEVAGVSLSETGFFRFSATLGSDTFFSNPIYCSEKSGNRIFWGDPHVHTNLSRCMLRFGRSMNFAFTAARYLTHLDWMAAADHVSNGRCDSAKWKEQTAVSNLYDDPPGFVTIPAYEASLRGGSGGDNNVYLRHFPDMFVDEFEEGNTKTLCEKLMSEANLSKEEFFIVPHHTTRTKKHGEIPDEIYPGAEHMPLVEIHSKWGTSEYRGNPNPLQDIHEGPSYVTDLLNRGLTLGFIAGTDTHATIPGGRGLDSGHLDRLPGFTAVVCDELERGKIFNAMRQRSCYAASYERIYLNVSVNGIDPGKTIKLASLTGKLSIKVSAAGKSDIEKIEIIRNGEVVFEHKPTSWHTDFTWEDDTLPDSNLLDSKYLGAFKYYYVRVSCVSNAQAWSSPVWITEK